MLAKLERTVKDTRDAVKKAVSGEADVLDTCEQTVHEWRGLSIEEQRARNLARLDELVIPYDDLAGSPNRVGRGAKRPLIFMHVPKCGGTTLEYLISKNYTINGVLHINAPALERNPKALHKKGTFPHVVMGHHKLNQPIYQFADRPFVHLTMLREPVGRILSYFNYLQTAPNHGQHKKAAAMTLEQFVDNNDMVELHNAQTLRLSGLLKRRITRKRPNDPEALDLAKENLSKRFTLFGLVDRYTEFLLMCRRLLGWADIYYERRNVSAKHLKKDEVPESVLSVVRERNALDMELFDFASQIFDERCRSLGIGEAQVREYQERNQAWARITNEGL